MAVSNHRRYCLLKGRAHARNDDTELAFAFYGKQDAIDSTPLAEDFPLQEELAALRYTSVEDLDGATEAELIDAGLSRSQAARVMAALSE